MSCDGYLIHSYTHTCKTTEGCRWCFLPDDPVPVGWQRVIRSEPGNPDEPWRIIENIRLILPGRS